ncbi:MAG: hypothetical protein WAN35_01155 [Terracidiphilus sp.]
MRAEAVKPKGEDIASAIRAWVSDEIKGGPGSRLELGKFFFAVSTGAIGILVSIEKLSGSFDLRPCLGTSLLLLFVSAAVALLLAIPKRWKLDEDKDIFDEYAAQTTWVYRMIWIWFALWLLGSSIGIFATLYKA